MNQPFDAGHKDLYESACSGLSAAWRRAAESPVEHLQGRRAAPQRRTTHGIGAWLTAVAVSLVVALFSIAASSQVPVEQQPVKGKVRAQNQKRSCSSLGFLNSTAKNFDE